MAALGVPIAARADVKIVSEVSVTGPAQQAQDGGADQSSPQVITTYYKGGNARAETAAGQATIYDGAVEKEYVLDPARKTYYVLDVKQFEHPPGGDSGRLSLDTRVDVTQSDKDEADSTKTVAGLSARGYRVTGSAKFSPKRSNNFNLGGIFGGGGVFGGGGGFPGGGGHHRRGGYPGGGGGGRQAGATGRSLPSYQVTGEFWLSDAVKLPGDKKASVLPAIQPLLLSAGPMLKPLADKLTKLKDIPLYAHLAVTRTAPRGSSGDGPYGGDTNQGASGRAAEWTTDTTLRVTSARTLTLDDALFKVPNDYQQVDPPIRVTATIDEAAPASFRDETSAH